MPFIHSHTLRHSGAFPPLIPIRRFLMLFFAALIGIVLGGLPSFIVAPAAAAPSTPAATTAEDAQIVVTFGFIRMLGVDNPNVLAGFLAALHNANKRSDTDKITYKLHVTTIPCNTTRLCASLTAEEEAQYVAPFFGNMSRFSAILKPNHLLAPRVIDHAKSLGGIPVIDPLTVRRADFAIENDFIINFEQDVESELAHIFTFMQQTAGCAFSAILYEDFSELASYIPVVQKMFTDAGLPAPAPINYATATDDELFAFMAEDPRRVCYVNMMTYEVTLGTTQRLDLVKPFIPGAAAFYGLSMTQGPQFLVSGKGDAFANTHFVRWAPEYSENSPFEAAAQTKACFDDWFSQSAYNASNNIVISVPPVPRDSTYANEAEAFVGLHYSRADMPMVPRDGTLLAYIVLQYLVENIREVRVKHPSDMNYYNAPAAENGHSAFNSTYKPFDDRLLIDTMFATSRTIGGFPLQGRMARECPPMPLPQVCACKRPTTTSFIMRCDPQTAIPYAVHNNVTLGQRDVASLEYSGCKQEVTSRSYPITSMLVRVPADFVPASGASINALLSTQSIFDKYFLSYVYSENFAPVAPARPVRFSSVTLSEGVSTQVALEQLTASFDPFIILGSTADVILRSDVLTLMPFLTRIPLEDNALVAFADGWESNVVNILPVLADYIHTMVAYYHQNVATFTSFHAIASTVEEALLIQKSMATFGYDVPLAQITVSSKSLLWSIRLASWLLPEDVVVDDTASGSSSPGSGNYPFVLAATAENHDDVIATAFTIASSETNGKLALAASLLQIYDVRDRFAFDGESDLLFGSFIADFWTAEMHSGMTAAESSLAMNPFYWAAVIANDITEQLSQRVLYDYTTPAAAILYQLGTFTSQGVTVGTFSNTSCTEEEIARNTRDRECQCTKGVRTLYLLSANNWYHRQPSARTDYFTYKMSSCGVVYTPYVPPPVDNSLSAGAIAGIAIACVAVTVIIIIAAIIYNMLFLSRNNYYAPKDPSAAFSIVFTDIQSSTALWARAPAAMSEAVDIHHAIIRSIIRSHRGYEVKTIGDSFMIAFKDPNDAVCFALEAQQSLFSSDLWNREIDACYVEILAEMGLMVGTGGHDVDAAAAGEDRVSFEVATTVSTNNTAVTKDTPGMSYTTTHNNNHGKDAVVVIGHKPLTNGSIASLCGDDNTSLNAFVSTIQHGEQNGTELLLSASMNKKDPSNNKGGDWGEQPEGRKPQRSTDNDNNTTQRDDKRKEDPNYSSKQPRHHHAVDSNTAPFVEGGPTDAGLWNGLRVRIGVTHGYGDIRKDPVTHGYDYYGTVVNTAARVEGVGHGGQILITEDTNNALSRTLMMDREAVAVSLGAQPLRGLDAPIRLYQVLPAALQARKFPPLRLHIEVNVTDDTEATDTTASSTAATFSPFELAAQLCATRQFAGVVTAEEIMSHLNVFQTVFNPTKTAFQHSTLATLGASWGFEKSGKAVKHEATRLKLMVGLMGRAARTINMNAHRKEENALHGVRRGGAATNTTTSSTNHGHQ